MTTGCLSGTAISTLNCCAYVAIDTARGPSGANHRASPPVPQTTRTTTTVRAAAVPVTTSRDATRRGESGDESQAAPVARIARIPTPSTRSTTTDAATARYLC